LGDVGRRVHLERVNIRRTVSHTLLESEIPLICRLTFALSEILGQILAGGVKIILTISHTLKQGWTPCVIGEAGAAVEVYRGVPILRKSVIGTVSHTSIDC